MIALGKALLLDLGCYFEQGFLNAKPMPLKDFIKFLEDRNATAASMYD